MPAAIITGSSRGIGRAIATRFAADGYDVAVNYHRRADAAAAVAEEIRALGREAITVGADVSTADGARSLVDVAVEAFDGIDHLVNNAGIDQHLYTDELPVEDFDRVMDVNVTSMFAMTKAALSSLRASSNEPSVSNLSSILAHTGAPIECHYAASKGAVISLTRSHAREFAPSVRVNAIAPGHIETDMTADRSAAERERQRAAIPVERFGQPEDVADAAAYLRDATFVTGEVVNVNGGEAMR
ncbi:MAG: SDR family oxidoreductase [Halobacteriota archaeon]